MNVIKNILTTKPYKNVVLIKEVKAKLEEFILEPIDYTDKNCAYKFKNNIENFLKEKFKDVPYIFDYDIESLKGTIHTTVPTRHPFIMDNTHGHSHWNLNDDRYRLSHDVSQTFRVSSDASNRIDATALSIGTIAPQTGPMPTIELSSNADVQQIFGQPTSVINAEALVNGISIGDTEAIITSRSSITTEQN